MISPAMRATERARKRFRPISVPQRETLERLSKRAGIELPEVRTKAQAGDALDRLKSFLKDRKGPTPDGPRERQMGNAVSVPVAEWIGRRIVAHEEGSMNPPPSTTRRGGSR